MPVIKLVIATSLLLIAKPVLAQQVLDPPPGYCHWQQEGVAIDEPLCGLKGDADRGRLVVADMDLGNCLACHEMPIPEAVFQGNIGPPLAGIASRYSEAQLRLRIVDSRQLNPYTIMPGFYRNPFLSNRVADEYWGKTFLTAQQVEDVVAYLKTLK